MTTTTTKKKKPAPPLTPERPLKKAERSVEGRARRPWQNARFVALGLCASVSLAIVAGHRGAAYLGDEIGDSLAKLGAPSKRRVKDIYGAPRFGAVDDRSSAPRDEGLAHDPAAGAAARAPTAGQPSAPHPEDDAGTHAPVRTRGVFVPGHVVVAYARRGAIPAVDTARGVMLRGVGHGNGLEDGDLVVRVGRAEVRSLREITGIVQASLFAGHSQLHGTIRRGETEIAVTVEIPTSEGGDAAP